MSIKIPFRVKETISKMHRQPTEGKEMLANDQITSQYPKHTKSSYNSVAEKKKKKKKPVWLKSGQRIWTDIFPKKTHRQPTGMWNITNQGNANQNKNVTSRLLEWLSSNRPEIASVGLSGEKKGCAPLVGVNQRSHRGKQCGGSSKIKNRSTIQSSSPTSGYLSEGKKPSNLKRYQYPHVRFSIIHNNQDMETKCSVMNITQPWNRRKSCHLQQYGWSLSALCKVK